MKLSSVKPQCFKPCNCGDIQEEHCDSRDTHCHACELFFGFIEKKHDIARNTMATMASMFDSAYMSMDMGFDGSMDDTIRRSTLASKIKSKRWQGAGSKWYGVIYK